MKRIVIFTVLICFFVVAQAGAEDSSSASEKLKDMEDKIEMMAEMLDNFDPAKQEAGGNKTTLGGYGEMHYNNLKNGKTGGSDKKELDFHRFIYYVGHEFSDKIRFFSEVELEHSLVGGGTATTCSSSDALDCETGKDGKPGEVEVEQAYIEFAVADNYSIKGGLFMIPVGILNDTHEPPTFYGVERNVVEKYIVPATWWEGGVSLAGEIGAGLKFDLAYTSGLNNSDYKIRSGRQKVAEAKAEDFAYTGRLKWTGIPGVEVAGTLQYQENITQGVDPDASATLFEVHTDIDKGPFGLRALYAVWNVDGNGAKAAGRDELRGWYVEPSFKVIEELGLFARYNMWDEQAGDSSDSEYTMVQVGLNYWPHEDVVVKLDYQSQDVPIAKNDYDGFNVGIGYQF